MTKAHYDDELRAPCLLRIPAKFLVKDRDALPFFLSCLSFLPDNTFSSSFFCDFSPSFCLPIHPVNLPSQSSSFQSSSSSPGILELQPFPLSLFLQITNIFPEVGLSSRPLFLAARALPESPPRTGFLVAKRPSGLQRFSRMIT